jgi:hypothetical protein
VNERYTYWRTDARALLLTLVNILLVREYMRPALIGFDQGLVLVNLLKFYSEFL